MEKEKILIKIWRRYRAYHFDIVPSLASASHTFEYQNHIIKITLPSSPKKEDFLKENTPMSFSAYRQLKNRKVPIYYWVNEIDATIDTGKKRKIRTDALGTIDYELFTKKERESLNKFTFKYEAILDSAFEYWIDVMRWCTGKQTLCQLSHIRQESHLGTYLIDSRSNKRFYCPGDVMELELSKPIKKIEWNKAQGILTRGEDVPIWQIYYAEAYERLNIGDTRGYIISLAISLETIVRHMTSNFLKEPINEKYRSMVNLISIVGIIHQWKKLGFNSTAWENLREEKKVIIHIFELRNGIMHRGENPNISKEERLQMDNAVKLFLIQGEKTG